MSRSINIYLAGPMTGLPDYHYSEFVTTAHFLRSRTGCHIVHTANLPRGWDWRKYIELSCSLISHCDAVVVLPDSEDSAGVELELAEAEGRNIPAFYLPDDLGAILAWVQDKRGDCV